AAAAEEQTEFTVSLDGFDAAKKIAVIKIVREITGQGLGEAKATVEGAPKVLKEGVSKAEADEIIKKIEEAGGKASKK
ncbi:MAG: 50S ribosomal protein L7/L12, partial [Treponema sp.]|nr:50S ribosomal protein L7/L12 [Treponema sp.]